jgi:hypothetical protein
MSVPETEGGQEEDDILGFPGDGFQDPEVGDPLETMQVDLDSGTSEMTEQAGADTLVLLTVSVIRPRIGPL